MTSSLQVLIRGLARDYCRRATISYDYRKGMWIAECCGEAVGSLIGPEQAIQDLRQKLKEAGHSKTPTSFEPAVGGKNEESAS